MPYIDHDLFSGPRSIPPVPCWIWRPRALRIAGGRGLKGRQAARHGVPTKDLVVQETHCIDRNPSFTIDWPQSLLIGGDDISPLRLTISGSARVAATLQRCRVWANEVLLGARALRRFTGHAPGSPGIARLSWLLTTWAANWRGSFSRRSRTQSTLSWHFHSFIASALDAGITSRSLSTSSTRSTRWPSPRPLAPCRSRRGAAPPVGRSGRHPVRGTGSDTWPGSEYDLIESG